MNYVQTLQQVYPAGEARALYRLVMEVRFGLSQAQLLMGKDTELSAVQRNELENIIARLLRHEPVQYILGQAEFCGRAFHVAPGVLIPRPETEELVHLIMQRAPSGSRVYDFCTGSGCIATTLALEGHKVTACDISPEALDIAQRNARKLGAAVAFELRDVLRDLFPHEEDGQWDVIVSNPPYVCESEAADMEANVLDHEPRLALFVPDADPLLFYRSIASASFRLLAPLGQLFFECNRAYAADVATMLRTMGFANVEVHDDQFGNQRFVTATR